VPGLRGLYNIPIGCPFAERLAEGVIEAWGDDPLALSRVTLFLPTRRACRAQRDAFLRASAGRALVLPRLVPLGDVEDEDLGLAEDALIGDAAVDAAPAMPELERRLLLAQLIHKWEGTGVAGAAGKRIGDERALALAGELARLIDQVETEELDFGRLTGLVPDRYAEHWQQTLAFLAIVTEWWPAIETERGTIGPARRHAMAVRRRTAAWDRQPCPDPVIVAGSTGSIPATRALIEAVLALPQGVVVLPGLDTAADDELWTQILADPTHPQFGLANLLVRIDRSRDAVELWPKGVVEAGKTMRARLVETALVPAEASPRWRSIAGVHSRQDAVRALSSITRIDCADPGEEGRTIALLMREALETPERTATLVTPDRALARRVAAELRRWQVDIDDSAGLPLDKTTPGSFLLQLAQVVASGFAPLHLLALLKHPLTAGGRSPEDFRRLARRLEIAVLRGVRPAPGLEGLESVLRDGERTSLAGRLDRALAALCVGNGRDPRGLERGGPRSPGRRGGVGGERGRERRGEALAGGSGRGPGRVLRGDRFPSRVHDHHSGKLSGTPRRIDGGACGPAALWPASAVGHPGSAGGAASAPGSGYSRWLERGDLADAKRSGPVAQPAHAVGFRTAFARAPHRSFRA
jgi:ATP-dependent helicase/nuclease subunit B